MGQGSDDLVCKETPELLMSKNSSAGYELSKTIETSPDVSEYASSEGICLFDIKTLTPGNFGYYTLNISLGNPENSHSFYLVNNNFLEQGILDITSIDNLSQDLSFDMSYRYSLLAIMDLSTSDVNTTLSYGPANLEKDILECMIRMNTTMEEFEEDGG